jgi:hypothetical protein
MHAIEMALERVDVRRPQATERREPFVDLHQRLGPDAIDAPLRIHARLHEPGLAQHAQVLRHRRLRQSQRVLDVADRALRRDEQPQDRAAARLGDDGE